MSESCLGGLVGTLCCLKCGRACSPVVRCCPRKVTESLETYGGAVVKRFVLFLWKLFMTHYDFATDVIYILSIRKSISDAKGRLLAGMGNDLQDVACSVVAGQGGPASPRICDFLRSYRFAEITFFSVYILMAILVVFGFVIPKMRRSRFFAILALNFPIVGIFMFSGSYNVTGPKFRTRMNFLFSVLTDLPWVVNQITAYLLIKSADSPTKQNTFLSGLFDINEGSLTTSFVSTALSLVWATRGILKYYKRYQPIPLTESTRNLGVTKDDPDAVELGDVKGEKSSAPDLVGAAQAQLDEDDEHKRIDDDLDVRLRTTFEKATTIAAMVVVLGAIICQAIPSASWLDYSNKFPMSTSRDMDLYLDGFSLPLANQEIKYGETWDALYDGACPKYIAAKNSTKFPKEVDSLFHGFFVCDKCQRAGRDVAVYGSISMCISIMVIVALIFRFRYGERVLGVLFLIACSLSASVQSLDSWDICHDTMDIVEDDMKYKASEAMFVAWAMLSFAIALVLVGALQGWWSHRQQEAETGDKKEPQAQEEDRV